MIYYNVKNPCVVDGYEECTKDFDCDYCERMDYFLAEIRRREEEGEGIYTEQL